MLIKIRRVYVMDLSSAKEYIITSPPPTKIFRLY